MIGLWRAVGAGLIARLALPGPIQTGWMAPEASTPWITIVGCWWGVQVFLMTEIAALRWCSFVKQLKKVRIVLKFLQSNHWPRKCSQTGCKMMECFILWLFSAYTYSDAKPNLIRGTGTSPSTILLSWRLSQVGCDLRGYQIRYNTTAALDQFVYLDVLDPQATSVEVAGLTAETTYLFEFVIDTFSYGLSSYRTAKSIFASTEIAYEDREWTFWLCELC